MKRLLLMAIFKDDSEIKMARRMLESFMPHFHGLIVGITGVTGKKKKLKKLIEAYGGRCIITTPKTHPQIYAKKNGKTIFASFAAARNVVLKEAEKEEEYDWLSWADVDDLLLNGEELQKVAKQADKLKLDAVFFTYWYAVQLDKQGNIKNILIDHLRERLIKPNKFKWVSRLHEIMIAKDGNYKPKISTWDVNPKEKRYCVWAHLPPDEAHSINLYRNIDILELQVKEEERKDPRTLFNLAKVYYDLAKMEKKPEFLEAAKDIIEEYLYGEYKSGWSEERANAWEYLGNIYDLQKQDQKAIEAYQEGIKEYPIAHILYLRLSKKYLDINQMEPAEHWLNVAVNMPEPSTRTTIGNPTEVKVMASSLKYNVAMKKKKLDDAIYWLKIRNKLLGIKKDKMLKTLKELKEQNDAALRIFNYAKWLKKKGNTKLVKHVLRAIPADLKKEQFVQIMANDIQESRKWGDKEIAYFAGQTFEPWDDITCGKEGCGGSETAIWQLCKEWAKLGYKPTVYCDTENEGIRDGVIYKHWTTFNWNDEFNTLILWRNPHILDMKPKAKKLYMDLHDVASQMDWTPERMKIIDKVFVKSKYHKAMLPKLKDKIEIISNGVL